MTHSMLHAARRFSGLITIAAVLTVPIVLSGDALACPNVTQLEVDQDARKVSLAEKALGGDDFVTARKHLSLLGKWKTSVTPSTPRLEAFARVDPENRKWTAVMKRAFRMYALVYTRDPRSTPEERTIARETMLDFVQNTQDPTLAIDAAEVFSHHADLAPAALMMLRGPAEKDLIGSAWAYAALARLEKEQGNTAAETTARERCRRMAKHPAICDG